jgi:hypothetical protein
MIRMGTMYAWFQRLAQGRCGLCSKILNTVVEIFKLIHYCAMERAE